MAAEKKHKCSCGKFKPYKRAYSCQKCWSQLSENIKESLIKNRRSLRLGGFIRKRLESCS